MKLFPYIAVAVFALGVLVGGKAADVRWEGRMEKHLKNDVIAQNEAVKEARADERKKAAVDKASAVAAAKVDRIIETNTRTIIQEIPTYVTPAQDLHSCVTYGLVRVYDAAILGVQPSDLDLPAGQSDDACAPVKASDLARSLADNVGAARQNAAQLDALIANVATATDIYNQEKPHD